MGEGSGIGRARRLWGRYGSSAAVAASLLGGGCFKPEDTLVNYSVGHTTSDPGQGGGSSGSGGAGPLTVEEYFIAEVLPGMTASCAENCHATSSDIGFLFGNTPEEKYASITGYDPKVGTSFLVPNPEQSPLLTHPYAGDGHPGKQWDDGLDELRLATLSWLELEAENLPPVTVIEVGPVKPEDFTVISLADLGAEYAKSKITFFADEYAGLLSITNLSLYPQGGYGIRTPEITPVIYPQGGEPIVDIPLQGGEATYLSPNKVQIGSGSVLLTDWQEGARIAFRFEAISLLLADEFGNTFQPCDRVDLYTEAVDKLPYKKSPTQNNGLLFCAEQCHGGHEGGTATDIMSLAALLDTPRDDTRACAVTRAFITPSNPGESRIVAATDPGGDNNAAHKAYFVFSGNPGLHQTFRNAVSQWIQAEGAQ